MNKITLSIVGALAVIAVAPSARAATFGEWLAYCAGGDADVDKKIKTDSMAACGVEEGIKAACSVLGGTPWVCATPTAKAKEKGDPCDELTIKFNIGAGFKMPGTWTVSGEAQASYERLSAKTHINVCNASPVIPTPTGEGGFYSAESGDITFLVTIKISGSITVTSPVGISVTLNAAAGCSRNTTAHYFVKAEINSCKGTPTPTPSGTPSPTPSGTPSPTPSGTPSPTPSGTPSPTPSSTPIPIPTAIPNGML